FLFLLLFLFLFLFLLLLPLLLSSPFTILLVMRACPKQSSCGLVHVLLNLFSASPPWAPPTSCFTLLTAARVSGSAAETGQKRKHLCPLLGLTHCGDRAGSVVVQATGTATVTASSSSLAAATIPATSATVTSRR